MASHPKRQHSICKWLVQDVPFYHKTFLKSHYINIEVTYIHTWLLLGVLFKRKSKCILPLGTEFGVNTSFVQSHTWHAKLLAAQCIDIPV
jgi:hypothetical protein